MSLLENFHFTSNVCCARAVRTLLQVDFWVSSFTLYEARSVPDFVCWHGFWPILKRSGKRPGHSPLGAMWVRRMIWSSFLLAVLSKSWKITWNSHQHPLGKKNEEKRAEQKSFGWQKDGIGTAKRYSKEAQEYNKYNQTQKQEKTPSVFLVQSG